MIGKKCFEEVVAKLGKCSSRDSIGIGGKGGGWSAVPGRDCDFDGAAKDFDSRRVLSLMGGLSTGAPMLKLGSKSARCLSVYTTAGGPEMLSIVAARLLFCWARCKPRRSWLLSFDDSRS